MTAPEFDPDVVEELRLLCGPPGSLAPGEPAPAAFALPPSLLRHHLLRSLVEPPATEEEGRALLAELARQVGVGAEALLKALARRDGEPRRYWRLAVGQRSTQRLRWLLMREGSFIAVGRNELGDLSTLPADSAEARAQLRARLARHSGESGQRAARVAAAFSTFVTAIAAGDCVVAVDGGKAVGIGRVRGGYTHVNDRALSHRRAVDWLSFEEVLLPPLEHHETLLDFSLHDQAVLAVERALLRARGAPSVAPSGRSAPSAAPPLSGAQAELEAALRRKGQVILAGPPGTGKTHLAERTAMELAARSWFGVSHGQLGDEGRSQLLDAGPFGLGAFEVCCFHPSFSYEDFVEGLRPQVAAGSGGLAFVLRDGLFKRLCRRAAQNPSRDFFLLIDEFNRGDVGRILGDLLAVLEAGRRGQPVLLPLSGERLAIPPNLFLLCTMNTADRSTTALDAALRRRFAVIDVPPDPAALGGAAAGRVDLGRLLDAINARVVQQQVRSGVDGRVGHAFFLERGRPVVDLGRLGQVLQQDVLPALHEHFLGDPALLGAVFGPAFFDRSQGRIDASLFRPGREAALERALLDAFPEADVGPP